MIKQLFVMSDLFYAGAEYQVRNIINACNAESDVEVYIALENKADKRDEEEYTLFLNKLHIDSGRVFDIHLKKSNILISELDYYFKFIKIFISIKPDIVFFYDKYGILAIPLFKIFGVRTMYSERNSGEITMSHWLYRFFLKRCNVLTCNSEYAKQFIEKKMDVNVIQINNMVSVPDWSKEQVNFSNKKLVRLLISARVSQLKNQMIVFHVLKRMSGNKHYKVIVAGKVDDKQYFELLKEKAVELEEKGHYVEFVGYVTDKEVLYRNCDAVILSSYGDEGTPNVILESFARKIPVLVSQIPQNENLFSNAHFLFTPDNADSLITALDYLMDLRPTELMAELQKNYDFIIQNYGEDVGPCEYVKLLRKIYK